jgi:WD40 repeat protein
MPSWPTAASHASSPWAQARDRESGSVHVVDLDEPARRWQWTSELMMPTPLAFSPDGKLLVVAGWQQPKRMELREVTTGRLVLKSDIRMDTPEYQPRTRFADAGRKLVTTTHEASDSLEAVFSVAFSPDSRSLATGAGGREAIKLWHVETGQELLTLPGQGIFLSRLDAVIVSRGAAESAEREGRSQAFQGRQPFTKR